MDIMPPFQSMDGPPRRQNIQTAPTEILLLIFSRLDVPDILAIRLTCRTLYQVSFEKLIWMSLMQEQQRYLPLPEDLLVSLNSLDPHLQSYSSQALESILKHALLVSNAWPRPRKSPPWKIQRQGMNIILAGMDMVLDRWLVVVYSEGAVYLYDTQVSNLGEPGKHVVLRASLDLPWGIMSSHAISLDSTNQKLVLAIACSMPPFQARVYEIELKEMMDDSFRLVRIVIMPSPKTVRALDIKERLVVFSNDSNVELWRWDEEQGHVMRTLMITAQPDNLEELWNGIIAVHFMGPYILTFKARSLELHDYETLLDGRSSGEPTRQSLKQRFAMTFRDVSFSNCSHSRNLISQTITYETTIIAYDAIQGLFQYSVQLTFPTEAASSSALPPSLEVTLIGVYPLSTTHAGIFAVPPSNIFQTPPGSQLSTPSPTYTQPQYIGSSSQRHFSASDSSSRGFVSTGSLGLQGKRAIWVERKRSTTAREVHVWSREPPPPVGESASDGYFSGYQHVPVELGARVVYSVSSYDLRDDITHCTFSELSGKIVLGHRSGDVSILDLDTPT
ncbi:hypothetical protein B0H34DRAFT_705310 [Crassisporium funariophilum]|nr:hypothetical protein B0H34DRAFT_705310 [Crassisporium funariophilum]